MFSEYLSYQHKYFENQLFIQLLLFIYYNQLPVYDSQLKFGMHFFYTNSFESEVLGFFGTLNRNMQLFIRNKTERKIYRLT